MKAVFSLCVFLILGGCSLIEIKSQSEMLENAAKIQGKAINDTQIDAPTNLLVFEYIEDVPHYDGSLYTDVNGDYQFHVTPGLYRLAAHVDTNKDGRFQEGEPINNIPESGYLEVPPSADLVLPTTRIKAMHTASLPSTASTNETSFYGNFGKVTALSDEIFSREHYATGLWRPIDFIKTVGGGLFMLEEYNEHKIPVLFVHGINGGPADWEKAILQLDNTQFQPWVFYYASGIQLNVLSEALYHAIIELKKRHQPQHLIIAAHSMGGLVTRSFIKKYQENYSEELDFLKLVITVNSPFGGMESAATGVRVSPIIVQSWKDVASGSEYIQTSNSWIWPKEIPYHLIFSYVDGKDGDGIVALKNQIPQELQRDASRIRGFSNTHVGTLSDHAFLSYFNSILEQAVKAKNTLQK